MDASITLLHALRDVARDLPLARRLTHTLALSLLRHTLRHVDHYRNNPHALAKLRRFYVELGAADSIKVPASWDRAVVESTEIYEETDSLLGTINTLRRQLVDTWRRGGAIDGGETDRLVALSVLIEDLPGVAKASLLRRAVGLSTSVDLESVLPRIEWNRRLHRRWRTCWDARKPWG